MDTDGIDGTTSTGEGCRCWTEITCTADGAGSVAAFADQACAVPRSTSAVAPCTPQACRCEHDFARCDDFSIADETDLRIDAYDKIDLIIDA